MKIVTKSVEIGGKKLELEVGRFAAQANAAVLARYGDTVVLATVVVAQPQEGLDFLPLTVNYIERLYAGGRIKGSRWVKREGRPSDEATLIARLIDRSLRPLFPKEYRNEIQVIITVLSVDAENNPDIPAICASSAALTLASVPWDGPVGAVRVGSVSKNGDGVLIANPTHQDLEYSELDLVISTTGQAVIMLEGGAKEVPEEILLKAIDFGQKEAAKIIGLISELQKEVGQKKEKFVSEQVDPRLVIQIEKETKKEIESLLKPAVTKQEAAERLEAIKEAIVEKYEEERKKIVAGVIDKLVEKAIRDNILKNGKRPDGRKPDQVRPIKGEVGILPRTHGSAIFQRGNTQSLTVTTLGSPSLEQLIESMEGEETKRYIHHYYMPPFTVGEVGQVGWPSRREVGHGALAEKALEPVIPSEEKFPYTIRVVSEIMSSDGSTSMASVCGSTLSLMDAGVPIKAPVAGIAMGIVIKDKKAVILSDILGIEDFNGDMDFKVAGTKQGVTAIQMDVKTNQLTSALLKKALLQAQKGRLFILEKMLLALSASRNQISEFAPKIKVLHVPVEKIGEVIGPGGRMIRKIISETGASVEVEDDGSVNISALDKASVEKAVDWIEGLTREIKAGEVFEEGIVRRIQPFGAFVEVAPGKDGLVHVSRMAASFVSDPNRIVKIGQKVKVRVTEIDDRGRINLSMVFEDRDRQSKLLRR